MLNRWWVLGVVMSAVTAATVVAPGRAFAQESTAVDTMGNIHSSPQALIGLGLVGAEAVILVEGAVGVRRPLILLGTGALGLIAGCIGGFFIDQAIDSSSGGTATGHSLLPMASTGILVVGLGLIIPTAIMYVSATMYRPEDTHVETDDNAGGHAPLEESTGSQGGGSSGAPAGGSSDSGGQPSSGGAAPAPASSGAAPAGGGGGGSRSARHRIGPEALLNYDGGHVRVGLPAVGLVPSYSIEEMQRFGVAQQTEWRVPLITASF